MGQEFIHESLRLRLEMLSSTKSDFQLAFSVLRSCERHLRGRDGKLWAIPAALPPGSQDAACPRPQCFLRYSAHSKEPALGRLCPTLQLTGPSIICFLSSRNSILFMFWFSKVATTASFNIFPTVPPCYGYVTLHTQHNLLPRTPHP